MCPPSRTPLPPLTPVHPSRLITEPRGGAPCVRQQIPAGCPHFQLFHPKRSRTVSVSVRALVYLHLAGSHVGLVPELSCWESLRLRVNSCWRGDAREDKGNQRWSVQKGAALWVHGPDTSPSAPGGSQKGGQLLWGCTPVALLALPTVVYISSLVGFPRSSVGRESACSAGDLGSIPGLGRSPGEGNGSPLQYPCLENLMDRGAWWATVTASQRVGHGWATGTWCIWSALLSVGPYAPSRRVSTRLFSVSVSPWLPRR